MNNKFLNCKRTSESSRYVRILKINFKYIYFFSIKITKIILKSTQTQCFQIRVHVYILTIFKLNIWKLFQMPITVQLFRFQSIRLNIWRNIDLIIFNRSPPLAVFSICCRPSTARHCNAKAVDLSLRLKTKWNRNKWQSFLSINTQACQLSIGNCRFLQRVRGNTCN